MNNKFMKSAFGDRATSSQTGSMHTDYDLKNSGAISVTLLVLRLNRGTILGSHMLNWRT